MRPELIVAGKELRDHVTSRRFLIIFAILLLISMYSIVTGMDEYNKTLDNYKETQQQPWYQEQIQSLQKQIQDAQANGDSQDLIDNLQAQLDSYINGSMPSVMQIFYSLNQYFIWICILLAIALGFDLITREKEEGSLKSLLSHPIYRDSVINGKTIGAITVLVAAMGATFLITIAIVLFFGVVPSVDELLRIAGYFIMALVVCLAFFAVAMAASTIAKNSSMAVLYTLGIVVILAGLTQFSPQIVSLIAGPAPEYVGPIYYTNGMEGDVIAKDIAGVVREGASLNSSLSPDSSTQPVGTTEPTGTPVPDPALPIDKPEPMPIWPGDQGNNDAWQNWMERQQLIQKALNAISPITNFQYDIANALITDTSYSIRPLMMDSKMISAPGYYGLTKTTVWDALGSVWVNILVLIAEILAAFAIAYVKFLRTDIR
ncbi:MAG TPA: ABC transporter permease subunit [Methanocella sp.]|jgi:ABC-2 type transport system permease protein